MLRGIFSKGPSVDRERRGTAREERAARALQRRFRIKARVVFVFKAQAAFGAVQREAAMLLLLKEKMYIAELHSCLDLASRAVRPSVISPAASGRLHGGGGVSLLALRLHPSDTRGRDGWESDLVDDAELSEIRGGVPNPWPGTTSLTTAPASLAGGSGAMEEAEAGAEPAAEPHTWPSIGHPAPTEPSRPSEIRRM